MADNHDAFQPFLVFSASGARRSRPADRGLGVTSRDNAGSGNDRHIARVLDDEETAGLPRRYHPWTVRPPGDQVPTSRRSIEHHETANQRTAGLSGNGFPDPASFHHHRTPAAAKRHRWAGLGTGATDRASRERALDRSWRNHDTRLWVFPGTRVPGN
ncbi:MAG TPA: hypothetical protein VED63_05140, partial [Acidimicrobiales bacterium]|nr:hypothetical protein [Acidimicrobiales bacterium]